MDTNYLNSQPYDPLTYRALPLPFHIKHYYMAERMAAAERVARTCSVRVHKRGDRKPEAVAPRTMEETILLLVGQGVDRTEFIAQTMGLTGNKIWNALQRLVQSGKLIRDRKKHRGAGTYRLPIRGD